eukprot:CAMPEP_0168474624 /NCGR_PEP_ID=MMETSP0228-20121227/60941_1 /TAXON_ID=133427 /ORGANISM="Protoceratium reticulatum, Strain CCCM 535 (=CCMP 1889)" /LENGTH=109 /DNA_ID=CAMNT_0008490665 /DNA_START=91 /DNA_END=416 /DNA_ORIENTATION=+
MGSGSCCMELVDLVEAEIKPEPLPPDAIELLPAPPKIMLTLRLLDCLVGRDSLVAFKAAAISRRAIMGGGCGGGFTVRSSALTSGLQTWTSRGGEQTLNCQTPIFDSSP